MDEFRGIWIMFLIFAWVYSAVKKAKKKQESQQQARNGQPQAPASRPQPKKAPQRNGEWINGRWVTAVEAARAQQAAKAAPAPAAKPQETAHHAEPLAAHMHTMEMDREGEGAEGIDCCHDYMLTPSEPAPMQDFSSLSANDESQRAHALLQGVVFSEILGRRPVRRYGGKRA